jgi:uncharacterized protein (UPF0333 family)
MFSMIPLPYKLLAGAALVAGVFVFGYMKGSAYAEAELARFSATANKQIADLEKQNAEISNKVVTEFVDRTNTIREKEYVYRDIATKSVPPQHDMSNGWVYAHDASATSGDADPARASDASPSGIKDNEALFTIFSNYSRCEQNAEQLIALQKWITDNKNAVDKMAEEKKKK